MIDFLTEYQMILIGLAALFGVLMAFGIGANDVANAMGTSVGSNALTVKQAILIAMIFEFAGAFLAGGEVTATIRKGIIDTTTLHQTPELLVFGMMASLLAAGIWLIVASYFGWPVSTTHSIVGAIVGFAAVGIGIDVVQWNKVGSIVASWVISPLLSGTMAFLLFISVQKLILNTDNPLAMAKKYVPFYMFLAGFMIALVTVMKGLKHVGIHLTFQESLMIACLVGLSVALIGRFFIQKQVVNPNADKKFHYASVEKVFAVLMVVTACGMAFAHGSNDVANAIGPLAAVVSIVENGSILSESSLPLWILFLGGMGIVLGLALFGARVMATIGKKITELTPSRGFAAELAAATTVVIASGTGIPVSTTHTLVGAVLGVGMARGIAALNLGTLKSIAISWIVTLPAGAILSMLFFFMFKAIFL
jgi:PiT family inorganic phosphate transporter